MKQIFLSDLDNTLIYSHRREIGADRQVAEWYEGRQISFMTSKTRQLLAQVKEQLSVIPCTTRSVKQYQRVILLPDWHPELALTANGGILLVDGQMDEAWHADTLRIIQPAQSELEQARQLLEQHKKRLLPVDLVDGLFLYTKSTVPQLLQQELEAQLDLSLVQVLLHREKVYVMPCGLTKGIAAARLQQKFGSCFLWAAGDSNFDVSMLQAADFAFAPEALAPQLNGQKHKLLALENRLLSETALEYLLQKVGR